MADVVKIKKDDDIYTKKINPVPRPEKNIGIDTDNRFQDDIAEAVISSELDMGQIEKFTTISQGRDTLYAQIDSMCEDSTISAVLEDYAQDSTEYNSVGHVMWAEGDDVDVANYVNFLLDSLNVDKHAFRWAYCLCKYGDVYLRLVHESEYKGDIFDKDDLKARQSLQESAKLVAYSKRDKYALYAEMQPNPAEIFELTQYDKTSGYIRTHITPTDYGNTANSSGWYDPTRQIGLYRFNLDKDVELFAATEFVHGCLQSGVSRYQEKVDLYTLDDRENETTNYSYSVKKGQSALYDIYKTWRELSLLESSILLARLTQSALTRVIQVEVPDMPKEQVAQKLAQIKQMLEQKSALNTNLSYSEYTNPGPIVNNIYVPTRNGAGAITSATIGGDFDPKQLTDLEYYRDKLFGALRVPKQLYGYTGDSAGFDAGKSIAEMSAKYAKFIKKVQNTLIQMVTDLVNIILLDRGLDSYINKFQLRMTPPASTEETNRAEILETKVRNVETIMNVVGLEDEVAKLKIMKALLSNVIENQDVMDIVQEQIEELEQKRDAGELGEEEGGFGEDEFGGSGDFGSSDFGDLDTSEGSPLNDMDVELPEVPAEVAETAAEEQVLFDDNGGELLVEKKPEDEDKLPSASDLGLDLVNM